MTKRIAFLTPAVPGHAFSMTTLARDFILDRALPGIQILKASLVDEKRRRGEGCHLYRFAASLGGDAIQKAKISM
jgi:hypothetical protein